MPAQPLHATLIFIKLEEDGLFDVEFRDDAGGTLTRTTHTSVRLPAQDDKLGKLGLTLPQFLNAFFGNKGLGHDEGLQFGIWLDHWLFSAPEIKASWESFLELRNQRPGSSVRLKLAFDEPSLEQLGHLPFELLAPRAGFLFLEAGSSIVRTLDMPSRPVQVARDRLFAVAWANPWFDGEKPAFDDSIFQKHADMSVAAAQQHQLPHAPPLEHATLESLRQFSADHAGRLGVITLVAHGNAGRTYLHAPGSDHPRDGGFPVPADDLASALKAGGASVALLWSCHAAQHREVRGSVVSQLLNNGGFACVVAAHGQLRAEASTRLAERLLRALGGHAGGRFDLAVSAARWGVSSDDLQWAALVCYDCGNAYERPALEPVQSPPAAEPAATGHAVLGTEVPDQVSWFRGRDQDIRNVLHALSAGRVVTLTGLPGAGKTQLARAVLGEVTQEHSPVRCDEIRWVDLAAVTEPHSLLSRTAELLGVRDYEVTDSTSTLAPLQASAKKLGQQHGAEKHLLLVLDNLEDLLNADASGTCAALAGLLHAMPFLKLLITSRRVVGDIGSISEQDHEVGLLQPPLDAEVFTEVAGARLSEADKASAELRSIVSRLHGHPRSLVLVAGQVGRGDTLAGILRRLETDQDAAVVAQHLLDDPGASPERLSRAESLAASLHLGWSVLNEKHPQAARMFESLCLFPGGLPWSVLPQAFGEDGERWAGLLARHHMTLVEGQHRRLRLPAPLRWYAERQWRERPAEVRDAAILRAALAMALWTGWLHSLIGTDRSATATLASTVDGETLALLSREAGKVTNSTAEALDASLATAWGRWAAVEQYAARSEAAISFLTDAPSPGPRSEAEMQRALGDLMRGTARLEEAQQRYELALPIFQAIQNRLGEANTLRALGDLMLRTDRLEEAQRRYELALPIYQAIQERLGEANTLRALGDLMLRTDRREEAQQRYELALPIFQAIQSRLGEANTQKALGDLMLRTDRLEEAQQRYELALPIFQAIQNRLGEANTLSGMGNLARAKGDPAGAFTLHREAWRLHCRISDDLGAAAALGYMAKDALAAGDHWRACALCGKTWMQLRTLQNLFGQGIALNDLALALALAKSDLQQPAVAAFYLAWAARKSIGHPGAIPMEQALAEMIQNFDPTGPDPAITQAFTELLEEALQAIVESMAQAGIDPIESPLIMMPAPDAEA